MNNDMNEIVAHANERASSGSSASEVREWVASHFPEPAAYDQPRYKCIACCDRGQVDIWHPAELKRIREGKKTVDEATYLCLIACGCKHPEQKTKYDPQLDCRVTGWHSIDEKRETLKEWLADRNRIVNHPRYVSEFEAFA